MPVVSIDLASRRYEDIGIAVLMGPPTSPRVELVRPGEHGRRGTPVVDRIVDLSFRLACVAKADLILIDGPQGWRATSSDFDHMRMCERCTRTPGKIGIPGTVKPRPWTRMAQFSIDVFDALESAGWPRFTGTWPVERAAVETFPSHAWRALGLPSLPGKARRGTRLDEWARRLSTLVGLKWPRPPSHDELQAVVAGLAGLGLERFGVGACDIHGREPFLEGRSWREGYIVSPSHPADRSSNPKALATPRIDSHCVCRGGEAQLTMRDH